MLNDVATIRIAAPLRACSFQRGFTAIELLIVMAIAGILGSVAYPGFKDQIAKARRTDALVAMTGVQLAEERWRANRSSYGSLADIGVGGVSSAGHYALQIVSSSATGYQILATAQGAQAQDAACRHLRLSMDGASVGYASGADPAVANAAAANRRCWSL